MSKGADDKFKSIQPFLAVLNAMENNHQGRSERMLNRLFGETNDKNNKEKDSSI